MLLEFLTSCRRDGERINEFLGHLIDQTIIFMMLKQYVVNVHAQRMASHTLPVEYNDWLQAGSVLESEPSPCIHIHIHNTYDHYT